VPVDPLTPAVVLPVVAGPVVEVEADVPGALAEVLPMVEGVPVCAAVPEAVVVLPGFVVAVLGAAVLPLGAVDAVFAPLMSALVELAELGVLLEAVVVPLVPVKPEVLDSQLPVARILCPTCAVRSSLLCSSTALPLPICSQNLPSFWATQPVMLFFSEDAELPWLL